MKFFCVASSINFQNSYCTFTGGVAFTKGLYDDAIRHLLFLKSRNHFVTNKIYKNRLHSMGEDPKKSNYRCTRLDNIKKKKILVNYLSKEITFDLKHPIF